MRIEQFEIWQSDLSFAKGSEQQGTRPCIILQSNAVSEYGLTTIMAPLTSRKIEKVYPYEVLVEPSYINSLKLISKIKFDQIRVIDKKRLIKKIGVLEKKYINDVLLSMDIIFDLRGDFR